MNPLDKEEFTEILKIINNNMPHHTDNTARIKSSFSQGLPKNLMQYSNKINNKFLNDNLHTIEELEYRKKGITNNFKEYQNKYYDESGILNHDLYFKHENTIYPKLHGACGFLINPYRFAGAVNGATLETNATDDVAANTSGELVASKLETLGTIGHLYNQVAHSINIASGNYHQGSYDNSGSLPNARLCTTGSIAVTADYALKSVTEYALTTAQMWAASVTDNSTTSWRTRNAAAATAKYGTGSTIVATWANVTIAGVRVSKIAHS